MESYLNFINSNILVLLLSKINYWEFNALQSKVDLNDINYLYLTSLRYREHMAEITKEFSTIGIREYELVLCSLKVKIKLKLIDLTLEEICSTEKIIARDKEIEEIPKEIGILIGLQLLDLSNNQIKEIPKEIGNLINLDGLFLSNNQIKEIPKEIGNLINLGYLYLSNNQIKEIPKEVSKLKNLRIIL